MSFGQFRNLRVVGEPAEMLRNLLGHKGERVSDKTIMGRLPYGLTSNVGDQGNKDNGSMIYAEYLLSKPLVILMLIK